MKRNLVLLACFLILGATLIFVPVLNPAKSAATPTAPIVPWAHTSQTFFDGIALTRQSKEPRACVSDYDGRVTMNAQAEICICDGEAKEWKLANTEKPCTWKVVP